MRKLISALVFGVLLLPDYGFTLGMGDIEVNSALNQQLDARIELLSSVPEDAETLIVKLATREQFARAGLDRPYSLNSLRFKSVVDSGRLYVRVTTSKPVREPFLNFLIEVDWPKGHLLREYTILLDPPVFTGQQDTDSARPAVSQPGIVAPVPAQSTAQAGRPGAGGFRPAAGATAVPVAAPVQLVPAASQSQTATQSQTRSGGGYRIRAGDTAWSLADSMRPDQSVSIAQMMLAMLRTNPEVFINENVNGLKKGYILRIPDRSEITSISPEEARALVREQNASWQEYQQALGVDQPASAIDGEGGPEYGSGIKSSSDARLSIMSAGGGVAASGDMKDATEMSAAELREQLALAREQLEATRVENEGLQGDVGLLEQKIKEMQGLLQIKDSAMAEIQSVGAEGEETVTGGDEAPQVEEILTEEITSEEEAALAALDELTDGTKEGVATEEETPEGGEIFVDEQAGQEQAVEGEEIEVAELAPVDVAPREEPGLVASLLGNPLITGGIALLVLILLAVGYILIKRRRDSAGEGAGAEANLVADLEQGLESDLEDIADSIDDDLMEDFVTDDEAETEAEEESFDSESTVVLPSASDTIVTQAEPQPVPEEEEDRDDVIAEADVYLAYGIYQQAEELLEKAIDENPDKDVYRVKLAETYFAGKNSKAMVKLGAEMKEKLGGEETPAWQKVVALGKELCPEAEIFQQAGMVADLDIDDMMPKSPEPMDFDLGDDSGDGGAPDLDLDLDSPEEESPELEIPVDETAVIPDLDETAVIPPVEEDAGETEAVEEPEVAPEEEFSLDIEASELDIETEDASTEEAPTEEAGEEDSVEIDSSELDFDIDTGSDSEEPSETEESTEADISPDAGLDLSMDTDEPSSEEIETAPAEDSGDLGLSDLGDVDEVNTKLDLARAYLDMGDHEGARDILDEVVAGGNDQQKQEAQELISQLD